MAVGVLDFNNLRSYSLLLLQIRVRCRWYPILAQTKNGGLRPPLNVTELTEFGKHPIAIKTMVFSNAFSVGAVVIMGHFYHLLLEEVKQSSCQILDQKIEE